MEWTINPLSDDDAPVKLGRDDKLEADANKLLYGSVGKNKRSTKRDLEKMGYESGVYSAGELHYYDPVNDWDTMDGVPVLQFGDIERVEPSDCADGENVRARSRENPNLPAGTWGRAGAEERRGLRRHIREDEDWGGSWEDIPLLGANSGKRKTCTKCGRSMGVDCFSLDPRNKKDGRHSWCKVCHQKHKRSTYEKKKKRRSN